MIVPNSSNLSDDSDEDVDNTGSETRDTYSIKYKLLLERCEVLQLDNERLAHRIQEVRKILRRCRKERKFLMDRLDQHGDNWRNAQLPLPLDPLDEPQVPPQVTPKPEKQPTMKNERNTASKASNVEKPGRKNAAGSGTKRKYTKHSDKPEKDPNAPKRPANPFFQFCQEQRPLVMERLGMEKSGDAEPTKQELTRHLASKWNTLPPEDKKVYYERYEKSKEKYAAEMQVYASRGKSATEES